MEDNNRSEPLEDVRSKMNRPGPSSNQKPPLKRKWRPQCYVTGNSKNSEPVYDDDDKLHYKKGGLVNSLHGTIYQLKLQMLFLKRALDMNYTFQLGTEVEDAEKFDDIVFKYKINHELRNYEVRFVQVKHKQIETMKKITTKDLLAVNNDDFSLQKYFISYRNIKKNTEFNKCKLKDFILYTNIDMDTADLKKCSFKIEKVEENDDVLKVKQSGKTAERFRLLIPKKHKLYDILRETSDLHVLVNALKNSMFNNKPLQLYNHIFRLFHNVLGLKVFDIKVRGKNRTALFRKDFLTGDNLSEDVSNFRNLLQSSLGLKDNNQFQKELEHKELMVSDTFAADVEVFKYSKIELPTDEIADTEIEEFLEKLVFAVNQPNEMELGEIITQEMGHSSQFNLLDAELVSNSFQKMMLDWFKQKGPEKGKEGVWLGAESGKIFMNAIENKVGVLILAGIGIAYPDMLAAYDIAFDNNNISDKLIRFISTANTSKKILHIINPEETKLSAIKIYQTLENLKHKEDFALYNRIDSYIFMRLKTLLGKKTNPFVVDAFKSIYSYHLLIVDCTSAGSQLDTDIKRLQNDLSEILLQSNKKIIIISKEQDKLVDLFVDDFILNVIDDTTFTDLTEQSQKKLLQREVVFQGQRVCFNKVIDEADEKVKEMIDVGVINKLLCGEEIYIGNKLKDLGEINAYYIERKLKPVAFSKENIITYLNESGIESDLFIVVGVDGGLEHDNLYVFDNDQSADEKFTELLVKDANSNIHCLNSALKIFTWRKSHGSISNLKPYKIRQKIKNDSHWPRLTEAKLIHEENHHNKIVIISDTAGMGKSTVLTHLSIELQKYSTIWIIRINLNDHRDTLKKMCNRTLKLGKESVDSIFDFIWNDLVVSKEQSKLGKQLLKNSLNERGNIAFFIDGFDEISPDFKDVVIDLIDSLRKLKIRHIFVTTRPNVTEELEEALDVFSYLLEPFTKEEQIEFLINYWTKKFELNQSNETYVNRLQTYVKARVTQFSKLIYDKDQEFLSIPLHTIMLAEVFQESKIGITSEWQCCKEFLESGLDIPETPEVLTIVKLYEKFVELKFYDLCLNKDKNATILTKKRKREKAAREFQEESGLLALQSLFSEEEVNRLLSEAEIELLKDLIEALNHGEHNEGIVDQIINDKPQFIHRTFAEYFAAFPLAKNILSAPSDTLQCINNVILYLSPIFMQTLIDQIDGHQKIITSKLQMPLLHYLLLQDHSNFLKHLLQCNYSYWQNKLDAFGKTPLHYAIEQGLSKYVLKLLEYVDDIHENEILKHGSFTESEYENSQLVKFVNIRDLHGKTALCYAIRHDRHLTPCNFEISFKLLLNGASIHDLTDDDVQILLNYMLYSTGENKINGGILGVYANQENKYRAIQEILFLRLPGTFNKLSDYEQSRILSYFFVHGRVQIIDVLLGTINDLEQRMQLLNNDDNSYTPLDRVIDSNQLSDDDRLQVTKYLLEHGGFSTSCNKYSLRTDSYITMILLAAAEHGHLKTLNYFLHREKHDNYSRIIYNACEHNQDGIVDFMRKYDSAIRNSDGNTALHSACFSGAKLEMIKNLLKTVDINAANRKGETPLFMAIYTKRLNVIKYLVNRGADINWQDKAGNTPLSCAISEDEESNILYLLQNGALLPEKATQLLIDMVAFFTNPNQFDINLVDINGNPRLHTAIVSGNFKCAKFLIRQGANINAVDAQYNAPLHLCVKNSEMVEILLQYGAIFDIKDRRNMTPYDLLNDLDSHNKVYWLLNVLTKLFSSQKLMQDLNSELLNCDKNSRLKAWGPYGRGHPDAFDGDNPMIFILNARNNHGQTLTHIAADMNDLKAFYTLLKFNDDYMELKRQQNRRCRDYQPTSIDMTDFEGNRPIHLAAQKGHIHFVSSLLEKGASIGGLNLVENYNNTSIIELLQPTKNLFLDLEENNVNDVEKYIVAKAYINARNESSRTPLHIAASYSELVVQQLIDNGANIRAMDLNQDSPLHIAAKADKINNVTLFLKNGARYNVINMQNQKPLDLAHGQCRDLLEQVHNLFNLVQGDNPKLMVHNLKRMHAKYDKDMFTVVINSRDHKDNTILHYAAEICEFNIVEYLLENGAMFNVENELGITPEVITNAQNIKNLLAAVGNMFENVDNIYQGLKTVSFKIVTSVRDVMGKSLLDYATIGNKSKIIELLARESADEFHY